ncbi:MAG TPA: rRNA maturation RNase YbeY [Desulfobacterales bacterium]|nr:rRNA maturation RNase YbeY [Desulfobacterales bacterium]
MRRNARILLSSLGHPDGELSVLLVDDERIAGLNRAYLNREGPTNVIAFPMQAGRFAHLSPHLLGDVVISVDTAWREAQAAGLELEQRLTQLLVHGLLHLCGYDHEQAPAEARRMAVKSRGLLKALNANVQTGPHPKPLAGRRAYRRQSRKTRND